MFFKNGNTKVRLDVNINTKIKDIFALMAAEGIDSKIIRSYFYEDI